jgi:hypothetical protein
VTEEDWETENNLRAARYELFQFNQKTYNFIGKSILIYPENPPEYILDQSEKMDRIRARNNTRITEKAFNGILYHIGCRASRDYFEVRKQIDRALFDELGKPYTKPDEPSANFYNAELLRYYDAAISKIVAKLKEKRGWIQKNEVLNIVYETFYNLQSFMKSKSLQPEYMFATESVNQVKKDINRDLRAFKNYYSKFVINELVKPTYCW